MKETAGPGFALREVPEPRIRDDEVLIRVRRAGVCGTDVHIYEWDDWARGRCRPPFVVGHEFAGEVIRVGKLVTDVVHRTIEGGVTEIRMSDPVLHALVDLRSYLFEAVYERLKSLAGGS